MMNRLGLAIHDFLMDPFGCLTSRKGLIWSGVLLLLVVAWLRWPRVSGDMISVWPSRLSDETLIDEYRSKKPFRVQFAHSVHGRVTPRDMGNGWHTEAYSSHQNLSNQFFECRYDWLHGEYYARLTYQKNGTLPVVNFSEEQASFTPYLPATNSHIRWEPSSLYGNYRFRGCDKKQVLAYDPVSEQTEYILVYAEFLDD